jgi:hypothetical protein
MAMRAAKETAKEAAKETEYEKGFPRQRSSEAPQIKEILSSCE